MRSVWTLVFVLIAGAAILATPVTPASADNGPHGGYSTTTDACAACHRAHTATAPRLLTGSAHLLCLTCHDGTGADTDVVDGLDVGTPGQGLHAGGFTNATMDTDYDGS
ncbi:MAG: cytochrome c3 family protein, partial [Dehalococcoidia bacterium]